VHPQAGRRAASQNMIPSPLSMRQVRRAPKLPPRIRHPAMRKNIRKGRRHIIPPINPAELSKEEECVGERHTILGGQAAFPSLVSPAEFVRMQSNIPDRVYVENKPWTPQEEDIKSIGLEPGTHGHSKNNLDRKKQKYCSKSTRKKRKAKRNKVSSRSPSIQILKRKLLPAETDHEQREQKEQGDDDDWYDENDLASGSEHVNAMDAKPEKEVSPSSRRAPLPMTTLFKREEEKNVIKLGRIKRKLLKLFKRIAEAEKKLFCVRANLGENWNPEPLTNYQKGHIQKKEKKKAHILSTTHVRMDRVETLKVQINGIRKDLMHEKSVFQRCLDSTRRHKEGARSMREENLILQIDSLREEIKELNRIDNEEQTEFMAKLFETRAIIKRNKLLQQQSDAKKKQSFKPTNNEVHEKGKFSKYLDDASIYDALTKEGKSKLRNRISESNWQIAEALKEKQKQEEISVKLNMSWRAIRSGDPAIETMEDFVVAYLEFKGEEYKKISHLNKVTDENSEVQARQVHLLEEIEALIRLTKLKSSEEYEKQKHLQKILDRIEMEQKKATKDLEEDERYLDELCDPVSGIIASGIFDMDEVFRLKFAKYKPSRYNISDILGQIETRLHSLQKGLKNKVFLSKKENIFVEPSTHASPEANKRQGMRRPNGITLDLSLLPKMNFKISENHDEHVHHDFLPPPQDYSKETVHFEMGEMLRRGLRKKYQYGGHQGKRKTHLHGPDERNNVVRHSHFPLKGGQGKETNGGEVVD
jgi:hypothetical protein